MKKFLLYAFVSGIALCLAGCRMEGDPPPPPPTYPVYLTEATYYGEKYAAGVGYYSMTFTSGEDRLRLEVFASVATDPDNAKLLGGTYDMGTVEEPTSKTYFVTASTDAKDGTLFWKNGTPVMITGGQVTVQVATGGATINIKLDAGNEKIEWKYSGTIKFDNQYVHPPRVSLEVDGFGFEYLGEYNLSDPAMGLIGFVLANSKTNYRVQLSMVIPMPEDINAIPVPTGTFEVVKDSQEPNKILAGYVEGGAPKYSVEYKMVNNNPTNVVIIESGTMTISKEGDVYTITTDFAGSMLDDKYTVAGQQKGIVYNLQSELPPYALNMTQPESWLEGEVDFGTLQKAFVDSWELTEQNGNKSMLWRFVGYGDQVEVAPSNSYNDGGALNVRGDGPIIGTQLRVPVSQELPVGTFEMCKEYDYLLNEIIPGMIGANQQDMLGVFAGTWYVELAGGKINADGGTLAGAMPGKGQVTLSLVENDTFYRIEVEFYDKHDYPVKGNVMYEIPIDQAMQALKSAKQIQLPAPAATFQRYVRPL